jgi:hypothetical protein
VRLVWGCLGRGRCEGRRERRGKARRLRKGKNRLLERDGRKLEGEIYFYEIDGLGVFG